MKPPPITIQTIAEAEKLAGLEYSAGERKQLLAGVEAQITRFRALRGLALSNQDAPAECFDPRLPETRMPTGFRCELSPDDSSVPGNDVDIAFASVVSLGGWLRRRLITSRRLTEIYLARIERYAPTLECMVRTTPELALAQADRADDELAAGRWLGPLHGVPWVAKDLLDTAGVPTTWGAEPYAARTPEQDATVVRKLAEAGAVLLGKASLGALAYGDVWFGGTTRNPWNPEEGSAGSSAGSASAVAAGLAGFAIGSETMGSIVSPAMRCGVVGLRPTFGRVSRAGAMALCWSLDKLGPICRRVEDTAAVLAAINGFDSRDPGSIGAGFNFAAREPMERVRVGVDPAWFDEGIAEPCELAAVHALEAAGVDIVEVSLPDLPYDALWTILQVEASACFDDLTRSNTDDRLRRQDNEAWPNLFRRARLIPAVELIQASRFRRRLLSVMHEIYAGIDVLIAPTFTWPLQLVTNMTGHPALTLRVGFVERASRVAIVPLGTPPAVGLAAGLDGPTHRVPHGITLWGGLYDEATLVRTATVIEKHLGCWRPRPPLFSDR